MGRNMAGSQPEMDKINGTERGMGYEIRSIGSRWNQDGVCHW